MCQIQIIQKLGKENINKADIGEFFKMMCFGSMKNRDAFGFFNHNTMFKEGGAFDASKLNEYELLDSNFIAGHNRFSTNWSRIKNKSKGKTKYSNGMFSVGMPKQTRRSGPAKWDWSRDWKDNMVEFFLPTITYGVCHLDAEDTPTETIEEVNSDKMSSYNYYDDNRNHHPFTLGDFKLIHNGFLDNGQNLHNKYSFNTPISTDSYVILQLIDHFFKKSNIKDRKRRISSAIQSTFNKLKGKYSVVLYDKKSKSTFYFKNILASFSLCKYGNKILCGSTSRENLDYLYFGMEREEICIKNKRVYLITSDVDNPVVDVTINKNKSQQTESLKDIFDEPNYHIQMNKLEKFLKKRLGFVPHHKITLGGKIRIAVNNTHNIQEKIHNIVENPKRRFGWYIISESDVEAKVKTKKEIKADKIKLDKMKGGKK